MNNQNKIKAKIIKRRAGKSAGKYVIKIEYFNQELGKVCFMERHAEKKSEAVDERDRLIGELKKTHGQIQTGERMLFNDLAQIAKEQFYKPVVIAEGRKISGVRSWKTAHHQINNLCRFFGKRHINNITSESLTDFKVWRLKNGTQNSTHKTVTPVKISTVNKELSSMRKIMRFAYAKGWVAKDVFFGAKGLIDTSAELERTRILTDDEEHRLLAACQGQRLVTYNRRKKGSETEYEQVEALHKEDNPHLKAIILLALDSGLRRGEILKLRWQDFDFEKNLINIIGTFTKTERPRITPLSERAKAELLRIKEFSDNEKFYPFTTFRRGWLTALRLAKIEGLRFHDLRRSAVTRWIQTGTPIAFAGKFAGHSQLQTTMKHYTATDADLVRELSERVNALNDLNASNAIQIQSDLMN